VNNYVTNFVTNYVTNYMTNYVTNCDKLCDKLYDKLCDKLCDKSVRVWQRANCFPVTDNSAVLGNSLAAVYSLQLWETRKFIRCKNAVLVLLTQVAHMFIALL
jgi:hypothetical protein